MKQFTLQARKFIPTAIRNALKGSLGYCFKFTPQVQRAIKQGLTVFTFHDVSNQPSEFAKEHGLAISTALFHRQMKWIRSNFNVVYPRDILNATPIPQRAAIISFDDGFLGSFEHGLAILEEMGLPAIFFLNMQAILERKPIFSAVACFLERHVSEFSEFSKSINLLPPFHLKLSPAMFALFENRYGPIDQKIIRDYQGPFADLSVLKKWDNKELVVFGNHLFDHWNASALNVQEFEEQYKKNDAALALLNNKIDFFAFPNGQPGTCYSDREVVLLRGLGSEKVFSARGGVNRDVSQFLLGRLSVTPNDKDENHLWFRMGRAVLETGRSMCVETA